MCVCVCVCVCACICAYSMCTMCKNLCGAEDDIRLHGLHNNKCAVSVSLWQPPILQTLCQQIVLKEKSVHRLQLLTQQLMQQAGEGQGEEPSSELTRLVMKAKDLFDNWDKLCQQVTHCVCIHSREHCVVNPSAHVHRFIHHSCSTAHWNA